MNSNVAAPPPPSPAELRIGVDPVQGGIRLTFAYPHLTTQVIIPEMHLAIVLGAIAKARDSIPKVILP